MNIVELIRLEDNFLFGTFGVLKINKKPFCVTLEPPDVLNKKRVSAIPVQQYTCSRHNSPKYGETFIVDDVPDRDLVLFHPGNRVDDTMGCILLAQYFGKLKGDRAVLNSGKTFEQFMTLMAGQNQFHLTISVSY